MVANARTPPIFVVACQRDGDSNARDHRTVWAQWPQATQWARRRHSPAAMYANTQLFGQAAAVCARTQFHATGMPRAQCWSPCVRKTCAETCFVLCGVFSIKSTCRHIDVGSKKMLTTALVPKISCVCLLCFTDDDVSWASPSSLLSNTIELCRPPLSITIAKTHNARQGTPTFNSYTLFSKHIFRFASIFKKSLPCSRRQLLFSFFWWVLFAFSFVLFVFMHFLSVFCEFGRVGGFVTSQSLKELLFIAGSETICRPFNLYAAPHNGETVLSIENNWPVLSFWTVFLQMQGHERFQFLEVLWRVSWTQFPICLPREPFVMERSTSSHLVSKPCTLSFFKWSLRRSLKSRRASPVALILK